MCVRVIMSLCACLFVMPVLAEKLQVVTSFSVLEDWAKIIGGEQVVVTSLIERDENPHTVKLAPSKLRQLTRADLLIINGLGFEGWLTRVRGASNFRGKVLVASDGIATLPAQLGDETHAEHAHADTGHSNKKYGGTVNPHAWLNFRNAEIYLRTIAAALGEIDPANSTRYSGNAEGYILKLRVLDAHYTQQFTSLPEEARQIVTAHNAFAYLAEAYQLQAYSFGLPALGSTISARAFAQLVETVRNKRIRAIFPERTQSARLLNQLSAETDTRIGPVLYADGLALNSEEAGRYIGMMQYNLDALLSTLRSGISTTE